MLDMHTLLPQMQLYHDTKKKNGFKHFEIIIYETNKGNYSGWVFTWQSRKIVSCRGIDIETKVIII
jgi:hypothetical protein